MRSRTGDPILRPGSPEHGLYLDIAGQCGIDFIVHNSSSSVGLGITVWHEFVLRTSAIRTHERSGTDPFRVERPTLPIIERLTLYQAGSVPPARVSNRRHKRGILDRAKSPGIVIQDQYGFQKILWGRGDCRGQEHSGAGMISAVLHSLYAQMVLRDVKDGKAEPVRISSSKSNRILAPD